MKAFKAFLFTAVFFSIALLFSYLLKIESTHVFVFGCFFYCFMYYYKTSS